MKLIFSEEIMKTENLEYLIDYIDELNSESQDTFDDKLYVKIKKSRTELDELKKATNYRTAIDAEMLDLLKGFVGIADKWIPHWKQPNAFKIQIKATKEFLSRADQP